MINHKAVKWGLVLAVVVLAAWLMSMKHAIGVDGNPISNTWNNLTAPAPTPDLSYVMPQKENDRLDILVLGTEGFSDANSDVGGPLLTDSIELFSYDKKTGKSSLVSIPRDLQVLVHDSHIDKLNTVYEYGYYHSSDPLLFVKNKFSQITGVYIDKVVVLDFNSFKEVVNSLGGIDVTLTQPFEENKQWGYPFKLPAGVNHLNGQDALYYARSRYSSTDFDRSRRQQQVMFAVKDKLLQLNYLSDPVKTFNVFNALRKDITTDIGVLDINQFLSLGKSLDFSKVTKYVISGDNLVYNSKDSSGAFILLPYGGNLDKIRTLFHNVLYGGPLPTPVPSATVLPKK